MSKKPAKKGSSKKKGASKRKPATGGRSLGRDMLSASASLMAAAPSWRATTRRRRKEDVPGYDPGAWDIPGHFELAAAALRIWPFYRGRDAKPFDCLRAHQENDPIYYDGGTRTHVGPHNAYHLVNACLS
jgi:hypothetical protein